jgi:hypothetical protein
LLLLFPLRFCFWSCSQCAIRVPQSLLDRYDCGILVATLHTRPPRLRHLNHNDAYVTTTIAASQSQRCVRDHHDCGIPIAAADTRPPRYGFQSPRRLLVGHDCGSTTATTRRRVLRCQHSNRSSRYSTASIMALQSPRHVLGHTDCGNPIATARTRSPRS